MFLSSTFSQFQQIHGEYIPEADEEIVQILNHDGFINPDVSLPTQYIIDNIPVLKVRKGCHLVETNYDITILPSIEEGGNVG